MIIYIYLLFNVLAMKRQYKQSSACHKPYGLLHNDDLVIAIYAHCKILVIKYSSN